MVSGEFLAQARGERRNLYEIRRLPAIYGLVKLFGPVSWLCGAQSLTDIGKLHAH